MIRLTTKSGAVYHVDTWKKQVLREGPHSGGINYALVPDGEWLKYERTNEFEIGKGAVFLIEGGLYRATTPVVSIEEEYR